MKNDKARLFAETVISMANMKSERKAETEEEMESRRSDRRWDEEKAEEEKVSGCSFGNNVRFWQTLAFADITEVISCPSFLRTLHLVPPEEKEKEGERNVRTRTRLHSVNFPPPRTPLEKGNIN